MKKKVVIDARMVFPHAHGIARYVTQIGQGLAHFSASEKEYFPLEPVFLVRSAYPEESFFGFPIVRVRSPFLSTKELFELPKILKSLKADLYHTPSFSSLIACPCPHMMTIHDLNHLHFGSPKTQLYYQLILKRFAKRAKILTTVSLFSQEEIALWLLRSPDSIPIIPNTIEAEWIQHPLSENTNRLLNRLELKPKCYFFSTSNLKPHKNLLLLIQAYKDYRQQSAHPLPLVSHLFRHKFLRRDPIGGSPKRL